MTTDTEGFEPKAPPLGFDDTDQLRGYVWRGLRRAIGGVDDADIEDFTQEAMVRIIRSRDTFKGDSRFSTWAMAIAMRVAFSALRRRRSRAATLDFDSELAESAVAGAVDRDDPGTEAQRAALLRTLERAIGEKLTDRQRTVILGELEGIATEVLAERLNVNRNALYKMHHDARKKLKRIIEASGYGEGDVRELLKAR